MCVTKRGLCLLPLVGLNLLLYHLTSQNRGIREFKHNWEPQKKKQWSVKDREEDSKILRTRCNSYFSTLVPTDFVLQETSACLWKRLQWWRTGWRPHSVCVCVGVCAPACLHVCVTMHYTCVRKTHMCILGAEDRLTAIEPCCGLIPSQVTVGHVCVFVYMKERDCVGVSVIVWVCVRVWVQSYTCRYSSHTHT